MPHYIFASRLSALRHELTASGLDGFLVPMNDEYQSEYVPAYARRIAYLSGFSGSAGSLVILKDKAAFFTDSRYSLQAIQQVSSELYAVFDSAAQSPHAWLKENIKDGAKIGYDPWLHSAENIGRLQKTLAEAQATAVAMAPNPVNQIWQDQPPPPAEPVYAYGIAYSGQGSADKRQKIAEQLSAANLAAALITDPASVAWLLNIRGGDVAHTPLPLSRAILHADAGVDWFVDPRKITPDLPAHLGEQVRIREPLDFAAALDELAKSGKKLLVDPAHAAVWITDRIEVAGGFFELGKDPCALPKACKNPVELDGMRAGHRRDGVALARFLCWLEQNWPGGQVTELGAAAQLAEYRAANNHYREPSFDIIAGYAEHGAIVHYKSTPESDVVLQAGQLFLLDSGGQYLDSTTDVTRTVAIGAPTAEMRDNFTRVLKGHIALAAICFPEGTCGADLDILARQYLWQAGRDYGHGTGHGVGCYLGVHEGPQAISRLNHVPLQLGMVVSNEPGYYKADHYGIRIENLQVVIEQAGLTNAGRRWLGFETLTLAPIDRTLIDLALMTENELDWLNAYHARVLQVLQPMLDTQTALWLIAATEPLTR